MLVGPSGCGKTTLISVHRRRSSTTTTARSPCSATTCGAWRQRERARFRGETIGFVFQQFNLLPTLSAVENVAVPLLINGAARRDGARARRRRCSSRSASANARGRLPDAAQRRPAAARGDRPRAGPRARADRLRRADQRARSRDRPERDGLSARRSVRERGRRGGRHPRHRIFGFADRIARMDDGRIVGVDEGTNAVVKP